MNLSPLMTSTKQDWMTPPVVLKPVRRVFGGQIRLDPCSNESNPTDAEVFYTAAEDGLSKHWEGPCYVNSPYNAVAVWAARCAQEWVTNGVESILLVPSRTGTRWFQAHCIPGPATAVCLWKGRLTFVGAAASAPFDSAVVYYGSNRFRFAEVFSDHGAVWL